MQELIHVLIMVKLSMFITSYILHLIVVTRLLELLMLLVTECNKFYYIIYLIGSSYG